MPFENSDYWEEAYIARQWLLAKVYRHDGDYDEVSYWVEFSELLTAMFAVESA